MSSSRERILAATRANKPEETLLPTVPDFGGDGSVERFTTVLTAIGGTVVRLASTAEIVPTLLQIYPDARVVASAVVPATLAVDANTPTAELAGVDLAIIQGVFGVAENGTIWVPDTNMLNRALPTITQHLVLLLDHRNLVATMHEAYARLPAGPGGYGVFIAGPSKTADIEQSLVVGAHGARSMVALLY